MGGGFQLEAQPAPALPQQASPRPHSIAPDSSPVLASLHSGQKRNRADAQVSQIGREAYEGPDSNSNQENGPGHVQRGLTTGLTADGREATAGTELSNNSGDGNEDDEEGDDDDLLVVKRRDVLDSSNDGNTPAEGIPLGAVELRGNKKKKRLRIDPGRTSGARTVFDEEGESLQPLALLAKQQLDRWKCIQPTFSSATVRVL